VRFSVGLPTDRVAAAEEFVTGDAVSELAAAAEAAGFSACYVTDHPFPDDRWLATGGHHALDPMVVLAVAGAATATLRLQTHVFVVAYRNPFLAAKSVLSLDRLSGGRVILGVASGYLRPEFGALGVDFDERNELTDEAIDAMIAAWTRDGVVVDGLHFHARGNTMLPRPYANPHPPIWVGGNSRVAIRRAVERGQGWLPFPNPSVASRALKTPALETISDLADRLHYAREHAETVGRAEPLEVCCALFSRALPSGGLGGPDATDPSVLRDEVAALEALGVGWVTVQFGGATRREWRLEMERFAADARIASHSL
jgi:probable F420-dependent oxidoreductase